ncbi:MAG: transcriptional repressor [Bacteroidales bacterium]|nr:transcriptional repressor [Bacteroidales bacterium]
MNAATLLQNNGLSRTKSRVNILNILNRSETPLSGKEICSVLPEKCDKSTVYRTLNALFEKKVIQRIIVDHEVKYALRGINDPEERHYSDHLHFKCSRCERLFCLTELKVKNYKLPAGFTKEENQFLVIGICNKCQ